MISAFISAHLMDFLAVWGVTWALASAAQNKFPEGSKPWKVCHVILAVSPGDFAKALFTMKAGTP